MKKTVVEFAEREEALDREVQGLANKSSRLCREAIEVEDDKLSGQVRRIDAHYTQLKGELKGRYESRRERIQSGYANAKRDMPKRADQRKGGKLSRLQMTKHKAERSVGAELDGADAAWGEYVGQLGAVGGELAVLEKKSRGAFRGYLKFLKLVKAPGPGEVTSADAGGDERGKVEVLRGLVAKGQEQLGVFKATGLAPFFSLLPLPLFAVLLGVGAYLWTTKGGDPAVAYGGAGGVFVLLLVLQTVGGSRGSVAAEALGETVQKARRLHDGCVLRAEERRVEERARIERDYRELNERVDREWGEAQEDEGDYLEEGLAKLEAQMPRVSEKHEALFRKEMADLEMRHPAAIAEVTAVAEAAKKQITGAHEGEHVGLDSERDRKWAALVEEWETRTKRIYDGLAAAQADGATFPEWTRDYADGWVPAKKFGHTTKFGDIAVDVEALAGAMPKDERLALPGPATLDVPLMLAYPSGGSFLLETDGGSRAEMAGALNNVIMRLLATVPPGKLSFTIFDPVGLGENFSGLMHLADYEEGLINNRIWTQRDQMEEKLAELNEHLEKIIQMYLRNEYETITQYNEAAGNIAEKYHFLVVADFPGSFTDVATKRLMSIAAAGARCGVYTLILWDKRASDPDGFVADDLRRASVCVRAEKSGELVIVDEIREGTTITLDAPPSAETETDFTHKVGQASKDSNRVEVPFSYISPKREEFWDNVTTDELRIPVGRTGATKLQYMEIGKGTRQHALFAGKTGSGKSTLFHVIVTNLAISCSPEQVEFYLIDFKKGVEFKCYAASKLPHAKVVAIESDREFGLSVLQRVDDELRRRGDLFRKVGVQDVAGYKKTDGAEPMPRTLLMIDEFQEFFVEDDTIAQNASVLMDRIVRQGRAFGIHVLLGSQTLGGSYTLARTTLGQMVIRVALQCNEADAYLIMDDSNPAPRLLSRPGEGIYNDAAGAIEGNSPFQVVWLPEDERDGYLETVRAMSDERFAGKYAGPIVFEGNSPSDVDENPLLAALLGGGAETAKAPAAGRVWMGAPNSIKGPTEAVFQRQSGNHLMMVGQREEAALAILGVALVSLAAQYPAGKAKFIVLDGTNPGSSEQDFLKAVVEALPSDARLAKSADVPEIMADLDREMKERTENDTGAEAPAIFFVAHNLQKHKKLRAEDDFDFSFDEDAGGNPGAQFNEIIAEGSALGIHVIAVVDSYNNVMRCLSRKALSEFEMRVLFQMSANDSASLIDSPKASGLGMHRALFYNEHEGHLETFRPYALPTLGWVEDVKGKLARGHSEKLKS